MKLLITGVCGFAGSALARAFAASGRNYELIGLDNFSRPGSETNRDSLKALGVKLFHGDLRQSSDVDALPETDFVIDAAANPSVLAGVDARTSSRQLVEHNLGGTINLLEYCKARRAGLILLSTSRVYAIDPLAALDVEVANNAFRPVQPSAWPNGFTARGVTETFSTASPISLYGATKLASETLALEYGQVFGLPVYVNRCGVLAGAGQFGRADQGIFAFWINSFLRRRPLKYIGFGGHGYQVRDCLHPQDLSTLIDKQLAAGMPAPAERIANCSGGIGSARSLRQLSDWCETRFGKHSILADSTPRPFDIPWIVLDSGLAERRWGWRPTTSTDSILEEIALHAEAHPNWLELSAPL